PPGPLARRLMDRHWPGALTLVVREKPGLPRGVIAADGGVAVRIPGPSPALDLVRAFGGPLTGTSANRTGEPPAVTAEEVARALGTDVDWVVPGRAPGGLPTTLIDVTRT